MSRQHDERDLRVVLHVRSLNPGSADLSQDQVIRQLEGLDESGVVDEFEVDVWGRRVALASAGARTTAGRRALARYALFKQWADENDRSINSFFDVRKVDIRFTGEEYTAVVFPEMALAEYEREELRHVAPCTDGEDVYTVTDRIDAIEAQNGLESTTIPSSADHVGELTPNELAADR